ncbi:MAG: alpha-glucosidase [Spirochaetes bacterium]|nr:alpha-glucosidase [Spirochaetota bacterium]
MTDPRTWWKHGVIYQVYLRSFYDSNGDGIGDIPGVIEKLDYLADLGIDAIWLSPVNASPMHDCGYDISDYNRIDPVFGDGEDFRRLVKEAHGRGMRIIMDLVLNHTSHLHPWFLSSRSSRRSPKRDWYLWSDGTRNRPPNNWRSVFGGSAWKWDELTGQYYLHSFLEEQPDLNWRNPAVREAMFAVVRYWLDRGVDGFRLDAVNWLIKDRRLRNNPAPPGLPLFQAHRYDRNRRSTHNVLGELRRILDGYGERMAVGEVFTLPPGNPALSARFLGDGTDGLHLAFDFSLIYRPWSARRYYRCLRRWERAIPPGGWPCHVLSNHDQRRGISRFGGGRGGEMRAKVAAALLLTARGTPFIYYGEEIGMKNQSIARCRVHDPLGKRYWPLFPGRDPARTPMQWTPGKNAGFTTGPAWLPVGVDYPKVNVEVQSRDRYSLLSFYRSLLSVRNATPALHRGDWSPVVKGHRGVLAYYRTHGKETVFVALNFSDRPRRLHLRHRGQWKVLLSTHRFVNTHFTSLEFTLSPCEATVLKKIGDLG